jgi:hypothetical protein
MFILIVLNLSTCEETIGMRSWARTTNELAAGAGARIRIALCSVMSRQFGLSILQGDT